jgi:dihydropteroate synthase
VVNARILHIDSYETAKQEIRNIGVDTAGIPWLAPKAIFVTIKLENISPFAANIVKQEMLGKGGDAAVSRGTANLSIDKTDVLVMGTYSQYNRLIHKLALQPGILKEIGEEINRVLEVVVKGENSTFNCGKYKLALGEKTYVMGILNVTPDSFSDGNKYFTIDSAVKKAREMVEEGADIIDIGGESTKPGFKEVSALEEINRVVPVIERLTKEISVPLSVDTSKAMVAEKALQAGAHIINDIWGLQREPEMAQVVAEYDAGVVMMHNQNENTYKDLMGDIISFLRKSIEIAESAGIKRENMSVDPGVGFGKTLQHNLEVMRRLKELRTLGLPVLLGTSRKSMIGNVLDLPINERLEGTAATVTLGIANGVDIIRVHDVKEMTRVVRMTDAMVRV